MGFVVGILLFAAALWYLYHLKQQDLAHCQQVLGLTPVKGAAVERGTTPEGFAFIDQVVLQGVMHGLPATLLHRTVRSPIAPKMQKKGSSFTVLSFDLARPPRVSLRIQPAGMLAGVESLTRGAEASADRISIDDEFDRAFVVYSNTPAEVMTVLTRPLRARLLAFRTQIAGSHPDSVATKLASPFLIGTFHIEGATARYLAYGSPAKATAEHVKSASPLLLQLSTAATGA